MSTRKIKLTVNGNDLSEVLKSLQIKDSELKFNIELDIEDTKDNYKYLSTSNLIQDWDFIEENSSEQKDDETTINDKESEKEDSDEVDLTTYLKDKLYTISDVFSFLLAIWKLKSKSPNFKLSIYNIKEHVWPIFESIKSGALSTTEIVSKRLMELYYNKEPIFNIISDVVLKLKDNWKVIDKSSSIIELVNKLFKFK